MGNNPINRNDPDGLVDFIYTPGNSRPRIEYNWSNLLSLNAYAEQNGVRYPLGDGGVPAGGFDQIIGQNVTRFMVDEQISSNVLAEGGPIPYGSNSTSGDIWNYVANGSGPLRHVADSSWPGQAWDTKELFSPQSLYIVNGVAQRNDYVGNVVWGATVRDYGVSEFVAHRGADYQSYTADNGLWLDAPRDSAAISAGFDWNINYADWGGSAGAGGGFVLYPSRPNTNMMSSVYRK